MYIPSKNLLYCTSEEDPIKYYFSLFPSLGYFMRLRLEHILALMGHQQFSHLLEIGYGSGILLPELSGRTTGKMVGLDIHNNKNLVGRMLEFEGLTDKVILQQGSVIAMPFADEQFDGVVVVSVLEHIVEIDCAIEEIYRVTKHGGKIFLGFPVNNIFAWLLFKLNGWNYQMHHPTSHNAILRATSKRFQIVQLTYFPSLIPKDWAMYISLAAIRI